MGDWATITAEISPVTAVSPMPERRPLPPQEAREEATERRDRAEISAAGLDRYQKSQEAGTAIRQTSEDEKSGSQSQRDSSNADAQKEHGGELTEEERREVAKLQARDREVRAHEQAHLAAAGGMAVGGAHYEYEKGPDGKSYAVGGEVQITVKSGGTPEEQIRNAEQAARAALAPANPSAQDRAVAAEARAMASEARAEAMRKSTEANNDAQTTIRTQSPLEKAIAAYAKQDEVFAESSLDISA